MKIIQKSDIIKIMWRFPFKLKEVLLLTDYGYNEELSKRFGIPFHIGCDFSVGMDDPIYSFVYDTAKVSKVNPVVKDEGTVVLVDIDNYEYVFAHLDNVQVKEGDLVKFGDYIGNQDSKGQSVQEQLRPYWQHLHFCVRKISANGQYSNLWNYGNKYANMDNKLEGFINPNENCLQVVYRVAEAICQIESGWNRWTNQWNPKAITLRENNNPGGLRYSIFQKGTKNGFAVFDTPLNGFSALVYDLIQKAKGNTRTKLNGKSTIRDFTRIWAPSQDGNNPFKYAENLVRICGFKSLDDRLEDWLLTELDYVRKYSNYAKTAPEKTFATSWIGMLLNYVWNRVFKGS
jgi:murein DD-endopeptidase MepM/ murein hydrolase activator NlpD